MAQQTIADGEQAESILNKINANAQDVETFKARTDNPHAVTKAQVGLGNCNDTSDLDKPVSNATQAAINALDDEIGNALDLKADLVAGKVPSSQLPSFVDDVIEEDDLGSFPASGETGKIYVALDTNKTYRWSGSAYVEISASLALGETSFTAYRGDRGKTAYDHSQVTGNPHGTTIAQISGLQAAIDAKKDIAIAATGGAPAVKFDKERMYGSPSAPVTGNITYDGTGAQDGVTSLLVHNQGSAPTFSAEFKKLNTSKNYVTGVNNYIFCTRLDASTIIYSIAQE